MTITITNARELHEAENLLMMADHAVRYGHFTHDHASNAVKRLRKAIADYKSEYQRQGELIEL